MSCRKDVIEENEECDKKANLSKDHVPHLPIIGDKNGTDKKNESGWKENAQFPRIVRER